MRLLKLFIYYLILYNYNVCIMTQTELTKQKNLFGITVTIEKNIDIHPSVPKLKKNVSLAQVF